MKKLLLTSLLFSGCTTALICGHAPPQPGDLHPVLYAFADENVPASHAFSAAAVASVPTAGEGCVSSPVTIQDPILSIYCGNGYLALNGTGDAVNPITSREFPIFRGDCQVVDQNTGVTTVRPVWALFCYRQPDGSDWCGPT